MKGPWLALAPHTSLEEGEGGRYLFSRLPLRAMRVNRALFDILQKIRDGQPDAAAGGEDQGLLLGLVAKGYLDIKGPPEPAGFPSVSVIIPVKDRPADLAECLRSLEGLNWPADRREIIVVDDGSEPPLVAPGVRILRRDVSLGPAAGRNLGARHASGGILAFLDADCLAGRDWLRELVPFFRAAGTGAVGGLVAGYYHRSLLDRYEDACSPLNMGQRLVLEGQGPSTLYAPTANLLVSRAAFEAAAGFHEDRRLGEDVDLCWRLRELGFGLVYAPFGRVAHKHRSRLGSMLRRRAEYGSSEAGLYAAHHDKRKTFVVPVFAGLAFLAVAAAILWPTPWPLLAWPVFASIDVARCAAALKKGGIRLPLRKTAAASIRSGLAFFYFAFFHLVRYYLVLLLALGFLWHPVWVFAGLALAATSLVDFHVKRPRLPYPVFLFFYTMEHLAYQAGVFLGCLKARRFGSYRVSLQRN